MSNFLNNFFNRYSAVPAYYKREPNAVCSMTNLKGKHHSHSDDNLSTLDTEDVGALHNNDEGSGFSDYESDQDEKRLVLPQSPRQRRHQVTRKSYDDIDYEDVDDFRRKNKSVDKSTSQESKIPHWTPYLKFHDMYVERTFDIEFTASCNDIKNNMKNNEFGIRTYDCIEDRYAFAKAQLTKEGLKHTQENVIQYAEQASMCIQSMELIRTYGNSKIKMMVNSPTIWPKMNTNGWLCAVVIHASPYGNYTYNQSLAIHSEVSKIQDHLDLFGPLTHRCMQYKTVDLGHKGTCVQIPRDSHYGKLYLQSDTFTPDERKIWTIEDDKYITMTEREHEKNQQLLLQKRMTLPIVDKALVFKFERPEPKLSIEEELAQHNIVSDPNDRDDTTLKEVMDMKMLWGMQIKMVVKYMR